MRKLLSEHEDDRPEPALGPPGLSSSEDLLEALLELLREIGLRRHEVVDLARIGLEVEQGRRGVPEAGPQVLVSPRAQRAGLAALLPEDELAPPSMPWPGMWSTSPVMRRETSCPS